MVYSTELGLLFSVEELLVSVLTTQYDVKVTLIIGTVRNHRGQPISEGRIFIYPQWGPAYVVEADEDGYFSMSYSEEEEFTMVIPDAMFDRKIIVPALDITATSIEYNLIPEPTTESMIRFGFPTVRFRV